MKIVGDHLARIAFSSRADPDRFDLFARSAFNRYYYSVFLTVRAALRTIDAKWAKPAHKDLPVLLTGKVVVRLQERISICKRTGQITEAEAARLYSKAASAAQNLSQLLNTAREVRRVADYEPEERVGRNRDSPVLAKCTIGTASGWQRRADTDARAILSAYGQLGLI